MGEVWGVWLLSDMEVLVGLVFMLKLLWVLMRCLVVDLRFCFDWR